jgi:hypothetical protein
VSKTQIRVRISLPTKWGSAKDAFGCSRDISLKQVAEQAVREHIRNTMSMYFTLKGVNRGTQAS